MSRWDVDAARDDMMGGPPGKRGAEFLICFGGTVLACAGAAFVVPPGLTGVLMLSQSAVAIPAALAVQRWRGLRTSADNPLWPLLIQILAVQVTALPAVFLVWSADVRLVPAALGAVGGAHFLPFGWLYRTRVYVVLGAVVAVLPWAITLAAGPDVYPWILVGWGLLYWATAAVLWRLPPLAAAVPAREGEAAQ
jgi:hypothetical protein